MAVEFLQNSSTEVITTDFDVQATLNVHPDADYVVFFVGVSAANVATDRSLFGLFHKYDGIKVPIMQEANLMPQNQRKYRFQLGRQGSPSTGDNTYEVKFDYTGTKTVLFVASSYKGVDLSVTGMGDVATETNADEPTALFVNSTASGNLVVDGMLYREIVPGLHPPGGAPIESGTQNVATLSGIFTVDNDDWGIVVSDQSTTVSGDVFVQWSGFTNAHVHLAGVVVTS